MSIEVSFVKECFTVLVAYISHSFVNSICMSDETAFVCKFFIAIYASNLFFLGMLCHLVALKVLVVYEVGMTANFIAGILFCQKIICILYDPTKI